LKNHQLIEIFQTSVLYYAAPVATGPIICTGLFEMEANPGFDPESGPLLLLSRMFCQSKSYHSVHRFSAEH
jgi:hypothetical protein